MCLYTHTDHFKYLNENDFWFILVAAQLMSEQASQNGNIIIYSNLILTILLKFVLLCAC